MRNGLIPRWNYILGDINLILRALNELIPELDKPRGPGRPPKHSLKEYLCLLALKELKCSSLRAAETDYSRFVCNDRVDHSVIHYWEKNINKEYMEELVRMFHVLVRIHDETVYPVSTHVGSFDPLPDTEGTLMPGNGYLIADKWYDVNDVFRVMFKNGYKPLVKPKRDRGGGYWRRKARKIFRTDWRKYRQRARGESIFGSLTNAFGDRLKTTRNDVTELRGCLRVIAYQVKIYMRMRYRNIIYIWLNN
jgi:hypothetical protein